MFDIPIELLTLGFALSFVFVGMAFIKNKDGYRKHWMSITCGMFIAIFALATDNVIMGYNCDREITYNNVTSTIHDDTGTCNPIPYEFTSLLKTLFVLTGGFICILSMFLMRAEE